MKIPHISREIIEYLDVLYPEKCPEPSWSDKEIWMKTGQRHLVRKLMAQHEDQVRRSMTKE